MFLKRKAEEIEPQLVPLVTDVRDKPSNAAQNILKWEDESGIEQPPIVSTSRTLQAATDSGTLEKSQATDIISISKNKPIGSSLR